MQSCTLDASKARLAKTRENMNVPVRDELICAERKEERESRSENRRARDIYARACRQVTSPPFPRPAPSLSPPPLSRSLILAALCVSPRIPAANPSPASEWSSVPTIRAASTAPAVVAWLPRAYAVTGRVLALEREDRSRSGCWVETRPRRRLNRRSTPGRRNGGSSDAVVGRGTPPPALWQTLPLPPQTGRVGRAAIHPGN